jgi:L-2-hydroxyglutarate oxidase LhgO
MIKFESTGHFYPTTNLFLIMLGFGLSHPSVPTLGLSFQDFRIVRQEAHHGIPGLIHLFGIESPGLTSSMAIADHVVNLLTD